MAEYIKFDEYKAMGGSADEAAFNRLELKSRRLIDAATHNRVMDEAPVRQNVKMCAFELIELIASEEASCGIGGREIASVGNDGVSIAYKASEDQSTAARQRRIMHEWLNGEYSQSGVNLLYCGVDA